MTQENKKTILVVEDDKSMQMAVNDMFTNEGYTVLKADDGEEGLAIALKMHPDLIFADVQMPKMSGINMIKELHKDEWGKTAQVVILSNVSDIHTIQDAMIEGSFFYMIKGDSSMRDILEMAHTRLAEHTEE
jgi:CheY-like chemotaxis protein